MNSRFNLPVVVLGLSLSVVLGVAVLGVLGAAVGTVEPNVSTALASLTAPIVGLLLASAVGGAAAWTVLFLLRRDGFHRMEWIAFLPFNYGEHNPFVVTSPIWCDTKTNQTGGGVNPAAPASPLPPR